MKIPFSKIAADLGFDSKSSALIDTLLTDSRSLSRPASSLFFAIRTSGGNDGHKFVRPLYDKGVRHFVVSEIPADMAGIIDAEFIVVEDVVEALQEIASHYLPDDVQRVAITGSRGKTTVKEWIFQLLEPYLEIARSPRSYNSRIGVPLSLWEIEPTTKLAIVETGISKTGEMESLARAIKPDTVIITNIGDAHADGFPSLEEKAKEKVLLATPESVRTVIYNLDSPFLPEAISGLSDGKNLISWSLKDKSASLFLKETNMADGRNGVEWTWKGKTRLSPVNISRQYDLENIGAVLAFLLSAGYSDEVIEEGLPRLHHIGTRLDVTDGVNGCSVIHDSFTSDVSSLRPAVDFMMRRAMPGQTPVVILSDILHETSEGKDVYEAVASLLSERGINRFIGVGANLKAHADIFPKESIFFSTTDELLSQMSPSDFENEIILVKGTSECGFERICEMVEDRKHETVLEVNLDSIVSNYNYFRSQLPQGTGIVAMVKAFGYGAGSYEIAKTLQDCGAAYLAVAVLDEGMDLRRRGITMPIMVMNPKVANYKSMFSYRLEPEIFSLDMLRDVIREAERNEVRDYPVHLKLDTGMHRTGFLPEELDKVMELITSQNGIRISSMFSHLATADCLDMDNYTELQLSRFRDMTEYIQKRSPYPVKRHVLNTAGILRFPEHHYDMVRLGIGLYGANTLPENVERPLDVVSTLRTTIISIRDWKAGETIGYGRRGLLERDSRIATIPIGYADGMNRHFGRGAVSVKVNGKDAPTVGNICMDACMIDVTGIDCKVGDTVEIFGPEAPVQRLADLLDTIPYEILTSVSPRVKRIYYRE